MSLPWFAFHIGAYVKDTMRLTTEGHGAYLLLMLDYYATEQAPPDDDDVLAAICKMPIELWQTRYRKVLAPFFTIESGFWRHERIEKEIVERGSKLASSHARAKAGGDAYARKIALQKASSRPQADHKPHQTQKPASSRLEAEPQASPEAGSKKAHLHLHIDSLSTESDRDAIEEEEGTGDLENVGTPIDPNFKLDENQLAVCKFDGATPEIIAAEVAGFIDHHLASNSFSHDWDATWRGRWRRWKEYTTKQAEAIERKRQREEKLPARVEVNKTIDYDNLVEHFKRGIPWPRGIGPDPDSPACKAPPEILIKYGFRKDPVS